VPNLHHYLSVTRARLQSAGNDHVRAVLCSDVVRQPDEHEALEDWMTGQVPLFYRPAQDIARSFEHASDFRKPIRDTLLRLPTEHGFQRSHFAEILAGVFCQRILGLNLLYSKLSLLSAEDTNAHKMDLLLYKLAAASVDFVFAEVKSSMKCGPEAANHHRGCFSELFRSFRQYKDADRDFDLAVIEDRMAALPDSHRVAVREALRPDRELKLRYAGVCVIDASTRSEDEAGVLATRQSPREFDVDLLSVAELPAVASATWARLEAMRSLV
jgi:hypothetical protein